MPVFEPNSIIYLFTIVVSVALAFTVNPGLILLWPLLLLIDDIAYFFFSRSIFDTEIGIQRGYQFAEWFLHNQFGHGRDLGFNLYDGNLTKSRHQGQQDKWDFMLEKLGLKPGDKLIDIGCGYGDWLNYARSKGIEVVGVNISPEQSHAARQNYGLEIITSNWKDIPTTSALRERLYGQFDAVTFMDTVEHYVPSKYRKHEEKQIEIYTNMFEMAHNLLKESQSPTRAPDQRIFVSCLHMIVSPKTLGYYFACYLQTRFHSGFYPNADHDLVRCASAYFTELERHDKTEDYRLTSVLDSEHFGSPTIRWTPKKVGRAVLAFLLDPHHLHKWLEYRVDAWMWHFGPDAYNQNYDNEYQKTRRHVTLWWLVLQKRPSTV